MEELGEFGEIQEGWPHCWHAWLDYKTRGIQQCCVCGYVWSDKEALEPWGCPEGAEEDGSV